jgi:formamidopyrimidine-DNA glycosylase
MIEIPESITLVRQLNDTVKGRTIRNVYANSSPHKFAWYFGDPSSYHDLLSGKVISGAKSHAGMVEIWAEDARVLFGDGVNIRFFAPGEKLPAKHQLHIEFEDQSSLVCSVQMYGGLWAFPDGKNDNPYYLTAKTKPGPLREGFDEEYFKGLIDSTELKNMSVKAFLATEQRIPGLGNGVLQDILFHARIHPKKKMSTLSLQEIHSLYEAVVSTLSEMAAKGGRNTEKDLFGCPGGYQSFLSKNTVGTPCPLCGTIIKKEAYLGGSIYYCEGCQPLI